MPFKSFKSVYLPDPVFQNEVVEITGEEHHHLAVARAEAGEKVAVFDGHGHLWVCVITAVGKRSTWARAESESLVPPRAIELILGQALIRTPAFELALEKAVEVGVTHIIPFVASRSNVTTQPRLERWQRIIIEAAKQSKRFHLPAIDPPMTFSNILGVHAASKILLAQHGDGSLKSSLHGSPLLYLVGPEGGWTETERESAERAGFQAVSLGSGILRSETAALVGAALIRYESGDMSPNP